MSFLLTFQKCLHFCDTCSLKTCKYLLSLLYLETFQGWNFARSCFQASWLVGKTFLWSSICCWFSRQLGRYPPIFFLQNLLHGFFCKQWNLYQMYPFINNFTPKISYVLLLNVCHTIFIISVLFVTFPLTITSPVSFNSNGLILTNKSGNNWNVSNNIVTMYIKNIWVFITILGELFHFEVLSHRNFYKRWIKSAVKIIE